MSGFIGLNDLYYEYDTPRALEWLSNHIYIPRDFDYRSRGINITATEIIVISVINSSGYVYNDRWFDEGVYRYSGEGKFGDQKLTRGNKALMDAIHEKRPVRLLVYDCKDNIKDGEKVFYEQGMFYVTDFEYTKDRGADGKLRKEYQFRLIRVDLVDG